MRFEETEKYVYDKLMEIIDKKFPALEAAVFVCLFDTKKRKSGGRYVIGRIKKTNDEIKSLAMDDHGTAPDYILFLDKEVFSALNDRDQDRIITHELYHTEVNFNATVPYGIRDHEVTTFYSEIKDNEDDPQWVERISVVAESVHDPENQEEEVEE